MASKLVTFTKPLMFSFEGNVYKNAVTLGDFDNDGLNELIIGNDKGDLAVFKGENTNPVWVASDLGLITSVIVGDLTNLARNSLLVITSCGFCYIFDLQDDALVPTHEKKEITPVHFQRLPANIKMALIGDINGDGCFEVVVALTDRIVRTYKWVDSGRHTRGFPQGKLIGQNKWELSDQIGGIALNRSEDSQSLFVSQPGGTCFTLTPPNDSDPKQLDDELSKVMNKMSIEFESLDASTCNNPKIQTEICGDIELEEHDSFLDYTAALSGANRFSDSSFLESHTSRNSGGTGYILATVDGLVMLVKNRKILWKNALKHPIISVSQLLVPHTQKRCVTHEKRLAEGSPPADSSGDDSTNTSVKDPSSPSKTAGQFGMSGHSTPTKITIPIPHSKPKRVSNSKKYGQSLVTKIVVGAQDGTTFIMNLRDGSFSQFNFHDSVCCCTAGFYGYRNKQTPCIVYASYSNQIYLYHDVSSSLEHRPKLMDLLKSDLAYVEAVRDLGIDLENREQVRQLNSYLMYGYNGQFGLSASI